MLTCEDHADTELDGLGRPESYPQCSCEDVQQARRALAAVAKARSDAEDRYAEREAALEHRCVIAENEARALRAQVEKLRAQVATLSWDVQMQSNFTKPVI